MLAMAGKRWKRLELPLGSSIRSDVHQGPRGLSFSYRVDELSLLVSQRIAPERWNDGEPTIENLLSATEEPAS